MDVRGFRDLEGARVAMDTDPRCVHALGMDKPLGFPDLEGLRLAMDADPRGTLAIGVDCFLLSPSRKSRGGGTPKPIGAECCSAEANACRDVRLFNQRRRRRTERELRTEDRT